MAEYRRVRSIIPYLNYRQLIDDNVVPDLDETFDPLIKTVRKYPPFVYKSKAFDHFGMLIDYLIRGALRINGKFDVFDENYKDETYYTTNNLNQMAEAARLIVNQIYNAEPFTKAEIQSYIPILVNTTKALLSDFNKFELEGLLMYNSELTLGDIQGHPDVIIGDTILDIKNTSSFVKMKEETYLQILCYWAMSDCTTVGIILPIQRMVTVTDMSQIPKTKLQRILTENLFVPNTIKTHTIGSTIHKGKDLSVSVTSISPCQVFVSNARSGKMDANLMADAKKAGVVIKDNKISCYIHSPYTINLCTTIDDEGNEDDYQIKCLINNLKAGILMNAKGVVVHTGMRKTKQLKLALDVMEDNVRRAIAHATPACPLMLETPCGEGTEVVTTKETLNEFFNRFSQDEKSKLRLCLDTCHVFVSGCDPLEYMQWWLANSNIPIGLIHFNDSATPFGSKKDRHARYGTGHIGAEKLSMVYHLANLNKIDMVTE